MRLENDTIILRKIHFNGINIPFKKNGTKNFVKKIISYKPHKIKGLRNIPVLERLEIDPFPLELAQKLNIIVDRSYTDSR